MTNAIEGLQRYFGYTAFRGGQEQVVEALMSGRDVLAVMPTGGGKSICYQLPALLLEGVTMVVSPLISLMRDQVMAMKTAGISAAYLNSSLTEAQMETVYRRLLQNRYKLLYVAPERLLAPRFFAVAKELTIPLLAVDEAHCISQWGQDFRPSYLKISQFVAALPRRPTVAAFTATATPQVREDINRQLNLQDPLELVTGFDRPNLHFSVLDPSRKLAALTDLLQSRRGKSGIVYCATRKKVEEVAQALCQLGFSATRYHAGLSQQERQENQEDFVFDRKEVMVATNAFGMGIDKSNVSYVIHFNMPKSLEAYYQEAGRAGRDGERAQCILLFAQGDVKTAKYLIETAAQESELPQEAQAELMAQNLARLEVMIGYCKTTGCLRGYILDYFGQEHPPRCENCGNCAATMTTKDVTREAQIILSCVQRVKNHLGYPVGPALITRILRGSRDGRILELGLDSLTTYGMLKTTDRGELRAIVAYLLELDALRQDPSHGGVTVGPWGREILFRGREVTMTFKAEPKAGGRKKPAPQEESELFEVLKNLRYQLARGEGVPAFIVCSNATLRDMAEKMPANPAQLLKVSGIGKAKADRYGAAFLSAIREWRQSVDELL